MKKLWYILLPSVVMLLSSVEASAYEPGKGFHVGAKLGLNFTDFKGSDLKNFDISTYTGYNFGVVFNIALPQRFALQPEILFSSTGSKITGESLVGTVRNYRQSDLVIPLNVQYGYRFASIFRVFGQVSPYVCFNLSSVLKNDAGVTYGDVIDERLFLGVGVGAGIDIWRFQLYFRYNWNLTNSALRVGEMSVTPGQKLSGLEICLSYFFL